MKTGKTKSVETICLLKQINILMIFAKFAALKIYFWPIAKFKPSIFTETSNNEVVNVRKCRQTLDKNMNCQAFYIFFFCRYGDLL